MMKKYVLDLTVVEVRKVNDRHVLLRLTDIEKPLPAMAPGQFVEVRVDGSAKTFLRRPISICNVEIDKNELWLLVACIGDGTRWMATLKQNDRLNCVLPLGNGFSTNKAMKPLLIGGGVGVAPLLFLGTEIKRGGGVPTFLLGARRKEDVLLIEEFERLGNVLVTTEDGSMGEKGFVTDHSILRQVYFDSIKTCGPTPMMKAVACFARQHQVHCEASLENMMACGLGACLCCVEKTRRGNLCVCKDGPVFNIEELLWS